jgi:hypothetical protein
VGTPTKKLAPGTSFDPLIESLLGACPACALCPSLLGTSLNLRAAELPVEGGPFRDDGRLSSKQICTMLNPTIDNSKPLAPCARCGANVPGGTEGCWKLFHKVLALEYSDPAYGAVHLLTVDAHALQHSEDHSPRSNAFHLIRLCMLLEHDGDPRIGQNPQWFQAQINGNRKAPFLEHPMDRGSITVADVHDTASPEEHVERVYRWARSVWEAYSAYHEWVRQWLKEK